MSKQSFTTGQVLTAAQVNSLQANDYNQTVSVKTASYVLVAADKGTRIEFNTSGSVTCTVNSGLFDAGDTLVIQNRGAGTATVTAGTATVNTSASLVVKQYDSGVLYFVSDSSAIYFASDAADTPLTTKGDLFTFSTAADRIAVGSNGETLVADSSASSGLRWQGSYAAGKNSVINGAFDYWQRGTTFTNPANDTYTADRWIAFHDGTSATRTVSQQALAPATITNFDSRYFLRYAVSAAGSSNTYQRLGTKIENVQNLTGTITVSFWAKADTNRTVGFQLDQYYGSGGSSATVGLSLSGMANVTTSWQRFTASGTMASISGKTIGDSSYVYAYFAFPPNSTLTVDIAGVQIEQGSVATGFTRAAGTLAGELAAASRYYQRFTASANYSPIFPSGYVDTSTSVVNQAFFPVRMRTKPSSVEYANARIVDAAGSTYNISAIALTANVTEHIAEIQSTITGGTGGRYCYIQANNNAGAYVGFSAEL